MKKDQDKEIPIYTQNTNQCTNKTTQDFEQSVVEFDKDFVSGKFGNMSELVYVYIRDFILSQHLALLDTVRGVIDAQLRFTGGSSVNKKDDRIRVEDLLNALTPPSKIIDN
jgi:hypothetical protein